MGCNRALGWVVAMHVVSIAVSYSVFGEGNLYRAALWCPAQVVVVRRADSLKYADSRRRGPFGGKRSRLAVHQTCSASPRKLLRSRIDQFSHAACCFARRLMCNCSVCCGSNSSKLSIPMLFVCMSECPWRAAARQVPLSALRRTTGVKKKIHIA